MIITVQIITVQPSHAQAHTPCWVVVLGLFTVATPHDILRDFTLMTAGALSLNVGKLFSELKLVPDNLFIQHCFLYFDCTSNSTMVPHKLNTLLSCIPHTRWVHHWGMWNNRTLFPCESVGSGHQVVTN